MDACNELNFLFEIDLFFSSPSFWERKFSIRMSFHFLEIMQKW